MTRHLRDLDAGLLPDLPLPCRACVFWESASAPRGPTPDGNAAKEAWMQATQLDWGPPGKACYVGDELIGFGVLTPGRHAGRVRRLGSSVSDDALLLATLWVAPDARGAGVARLLLQALLRETHQRGGRALEAYGARGERNQGPCVLPEAFLLVNGFSVLYDDAQFPLLRLELRHTARWADSLKDALESVLGALRGRRAPVPVRSSPG